MRLSELPDQTARDVKRDGDSAADIERAAAEFGLALNSRMQSDTHIKWVVPRGCILPPKIIKLCEIENEGNMTIIMLPRSYELASVRYVDTVPYIIALLSVASTGIWWWFFQEVGEI
jgi:hypothetical protein